MEPFVLGKEEAPCTTWQYTRSNRRRSADNDHAHHRHQPCAPYLRRVACMGSPPSRGRMPCGYQSLPTAWAKLMLLLSQSARKNGLTEISSVRNLVEMRGFASSAHPEMAALPGVAGLITGMAELPQHHAPARRNLGLASHKNKQIHGMKHT